MFIIEKATTTQAKAKVAIVGPPGCGKTYTALVTAKELGEKILVIDTENKTSAKYVKQLGPYDILALTEYSISTYVEALEHAAAHDYDVVIVDSLSHAWAGKGGALEQAEQAGRDSFKSNKFAGWSVVTPLQNRLVDTILQYPTHLIATMRMKIEYTLVTENGKQVPKKLGMGIVQRDSFEYEFDIIAQMDIDHNLVITKTRCFELDEFTATRPDGTMGRMIAGWLSDGEPVKMFASLEDLLYQIHLDFNLEETEAKSKIKELGFTMLPKSNGELKQRLQEIYAAVRAQV